MCNACGFYCCASDQFDRCGCVHCDCPECWPVCEICEMPEDECCCEGEDYDFDIDDVGA